MTDVHTGDPPLARTDRETGARTYTHPITGEVFPSVTTILDIVAKERLQYWIGSEVQKYAFDHAPAIVQSLRYPPCEQRGSDRCGRCRDCVALDVRRAPDRIRGDAASRGKRVHAAAEYHTLHGVFPPHEDDIAPYLGQYLRYIEQFKPVFDATEMTVISRTHGYAGTLDAITRLAWCPPKYRHLIGLPMITDIKTGRNVWREASLQLSAYRHADVVLLPDGTEMPMPDSIDTGLVLHIRSDDYWVRPADVTADTFTAFLRILDAYRWQNGTNPIKRAMYKPKGKE